MADPATQIPLKVKAINRLEIAWTSGAVALVAVLFAGALVTMRAVAGADAPAVRVTVIGD